jgi:homoserine O-acetyltransferase
MDYQSSADNLPTEFITEDLLKQLVGKPKATGAWRDGDPRGDREFALLGTVELESGKQVENVKLAYETWGTLNADGSNAVLVLHALTGDSHASGTAGWWNGFIGPNLAIDTNKFFVVAPNIFGGCQGSTGPASLDKKGKELGSRFPYLTIRDQVKTQVLFSDQLNIDKWYAIIGGSMGGMHVLEWAIGYPKRVERIAVIAATAKTSADEIASNSLQIEAIKADPNFAKGDYYDAKAGFGPHVGLGLARRMALLNYRSANELNERFDRSWQSDISPLGEGGRFAVSSYLDFHGNRFTRRFDANSYITLVEAMNSHDVGRGRKSTATALKLIKAKTLVLGIANDRLFPIENQRFIADNLNTDLVGGKLQVIESEYGHDGFLIETGKVAPLIAKLLRS